MNVNLGPELEELIRRKVVSGLYSNNSEVICAGLRLIEEQDRLREASLKGLQTALAKSLAQADRGELRDGAEVFSEMKAFLKRRRKSNRS